MRIAMIDPSLFTLPYDRALARGLVEAGHEVVLHGRRVEPEDGASDGVRLAEDFYRVAGLGLLKSVPKPARLAVKGVDHLFSMARLLRHLGSNRPDVIHFQWLPLPAIDLRFLRRLRAIAPLVLTVHDTNPFNGDPAAGMQRVGFFPCLERFERLIVHTRQGEARLLAHGLPNCRIAPVAHGLLGASLPQLAGDAMSGPLTFVLFGKIKPYKGADLLIEAFATLPMHLRAAARVRIVGKAYMDVAPLRALAAHRGVADWVSIETGFVADADIPDLFAHGTVAVFPYREIEASGVFSLAMTHGRPIIASDVGSFGELVTDGTHGHLVKSGDVPALGAALAHMVADRRFAAVCADNVRRLAAGVPSWRKVAQQTEAVYLAAGARTINVASPRVA